MNSIHFKVRISNIFIEIFLNLKLNVLCHPSWGRKKLVIQIHHAHVDIALILSYVKGYLSLAGFLCDDLLQLNYQHIQFGLGVFL